MLSTYLKRKISLYFIGYIIISLTFVRCSSLSYDFPTYEFEAKSKVSLTELLKNLPVISSVFESIDPVTFNKKLDTLAQSDLEVVTRLMFNLSSLMKDDPQFPFLLDQLAGPIKRFIHYYLLPEHQNEFESAFKAGLSFLDISPQGIRLLTEALGDGVRSVADNPNLFPSAKKDKFQGKPLWSNCYGSDFEDTKPIEIEGTRSAYYGIYDALRVARCFYDGYDEIPAYPGAFIQKSLQLAQDQILVEVKMKNIMTLLKDIDSMKESESLISDWLVADPKKSEITDYLIKTGYSLLKKDFIYRDGFDLLNKEMAHLTALSPTFNPLSVDAYKNKFLLQWLLVSLFDDIDKLSHIESYISLPQNDPLYNFGASLFDNTIAGTSNPKGIRSLFSNGGFSLSNMRNLLLDGKTFKGVLNSNANIVTFPGLLKDDGTSNIANDGALRKLMSITSEDKTLKPYRLKMNQKLQSLMNVPTSYEGEGMFESIVNNLYYHFLDTYYDKNKNTWVLNKLDALSSFSNSHRNLSDYLARMQYTLQNTVNLDAKGLRRNDPNSSQMPFLTSLLFTLAAANGTVDLNDSPGVLTLAKSLQAMKANVSTAGKRTIAVDLSLVPKTDGWKPRQDISDITGLANYIFEPALGTNFAPQVAVSLYCNTGNCLGGHNVIFRNNEPFLLTGGMKDFELITPGLFYTKNGSADGGKPEDQRLSGKFSAHQGDIYFESNGIGDDSKGHKTGDWVVTELIFGAWNGYGPYTIQGKAPDGSKLKYENDFYTDRYTTRICDGTANGENKYRASHNLAEQQCPDEWVRYNSMGQNKGVVTENLSSPSATNVGSTVRDNGGNYHFYQNIYRPKSASDPCWVKSLGSTYGYARYGFLRPSNDLNYTNNELCNNWEMVQIDFDDIEQAVQANVEWLFYKKKYVFVIPIYGFAGMSLYGLKNEGASFSVFATIAANGIIGVAKAKRAGAGVSNNGRWRNQKDINMMSVDSKGTIPLVPQGSIGRGLVKESAAQGASFTSRFGATSFDAADSSVTLETTVKQWGSIITSVVRIEEELFNTLGDGPVASPLLGENIDSIESLVAAKYPLAEIIAANYHIGSTDISKFKPFYDLYFPNDEYNSSGNKIADGQPDLFQKYLRSKIYTGCRDLNNKKISFCLTAVELPPVPKIKGIYYPTRYNLNGSPVTNSWREYTGPTEGKFTGLLFPIVLSMGTLHADGDIIKENGDTMSGSENIDNVSIKYYDLKGFRKYIPDLLNMLLIFNDTQKNSSDNTPVYNANALINRLIETSSGARNGLLPTILNSKYFNLGDMSSLLEGIESIISSTFKETLCQFTITKSSSCPSSSLGISALDKLEFFFSQNAVTKGFFVTNYLGDNAKSAEPLEQLKLFFNYIRNLTNDDDIVVAIRDGVKSLNSFLVLHGAPFQLPLTDNHINIFIALIKEQDSSGEYLTDKIINLLIDSSLNDLYTYYDFRFSNVTSFNPNRFITLIEDIDKVLSDYFNVNYKKNLLVSQWLLGEQSCSGNSTGFYDENQNGIKDNGFVSFSKLAATKSTYNYASNVGSNCNITVSSPDLFNFNSYIFNTKTIMSVVKSYILGLNESKLFSTSSENKGIITHLYQLSDFNTVANNIKDTIIEGTLGKAYDYEFTELSNDVNEDGVISNTEYFDINKNDTYDRVNFRTLVTKMGDVYKNTLFKKNLLGNPTKDLGDIPNAIIHSSYELLNPYNQECANNLNNEKCIYISKKIYDAQSKISTSLNVSPQQLLSFKKVIGNFLYDTDKNNYVYPISRIASPTYKILSAFTGDYDRLADVMIGGFDSNGLFSYLLTTIKVPDRYSGIDLLQDVYTLLDNKNFREYGDPKTFWYQLGSILEETATTIYTTNHMDWRNQKNTPVRANVSRNINYYNILTNFNH